MAHYSNKKLVGRESKPSNQMRLKTYHSGAIYYGIFHSTDIRLQSPIQLIKGMIGMSIGFGDRHFLPIIDHFRDDLLCHLRGSCVGGRGCCRNVALRLEITLILIDDRLIGDMRSLVSFTSHGVGSGSSIASSKWEQ
jgi:hypothetical protein